MVEFNCEICGAFKRKGWSASMPGRPRFCSWACKSESQRRAKPVTREWLEQKYVVEKMDTTMIAAIVIRDPKSVWNWLKDFGIPTRKRGTDVRQHFVKGAPSPFTGLKHTQKTKDLIRAARLADGGVPYLKNGVHHLKGKRGADTPNWKGGVTPERQVFYASQEWRSAVAKVWQRAAAKCERCGYRQTKADRESGYFHVHHIVSFMVRRLRCAVDNLALLCGDCHRWVHSRKNVGKEFIREENA